MFRCVPWLWLAPIVAGLYGAARWSDLPDRVASHFAADGRADGWMEKDAFLAVDLALKPWRIERRLGG